MCKSCKSRTYMGIAQKSKGLPIVGIEFVLQIWFPESWAIAMMVDWCIGCYPHRRLLGGGINIGLMISKQQEYVRLRVKINHRYGDQNARTDKESCWKFEVQSRSRKEGVYTQLWWHSRSRISYSMYDIYIICISILYSTVIDII